MVPIVISDEIFEGSPQLKFVNVPYNYNGYSFAGMEVLKDEKPPDPTDSPTTSAGAEVFRLPKCSKLVISLCAILSYFI